MNKHLYAVVLVGGSGTRFWPLSRKAVPKQFLSIYGQGSLFEQTIRRLRGRLAPKNIFIVSNIQYKKQVAQQAKTLRIPSGNILLEPSAKNTAPAVCWASEVIRRRDPQAVVGVFPSDHLILNAKEFWKAIDNATRLACAGYLVTLGIGPTRPETGYGYIKAGPLKRYKYPLLKAVKFTEKPSLKRAAQFVKSGHYFWNSGMFIWTANVILAEFRKYQPAIAGYFKKNRTVSSQTWRSLPSISIDYGILERSTRVACVAARHLGWSDLGSWEALHEVMKKDSAGNAARGDVIHLHSQGTLVWGQTRLIAAVGLEDIVIVDTPDALLICRRDMSQKVKDVVDLLAQGKRKEHLDHSRST